jgi:hypothetical protein
MQGPKRSDIAPKDVVDSFIRELRAIRDDFFHRRAQQKTPPRPAYILDDDLEDVDDV